MKNYRDAVWNGHNETPSQRFELMPAINAKFCQNSESNRPINRQCNFNLGLQFLHSENVQSA